MKTLTGKKAENLKAKYLNATAQSIFDLYKEPSIYKIHADNKIYRECLLKGITGTYRVWGANTYTFSAGYRFYDYKGNEILVVYTGRNVYYVKM